jgi:hypothetical protein
VLQVSRCNIAACGRHGSQPGSAVGLLLIVAMLFLFLSIDLFLSNDLGDGSWQASILGIAHHWHQQPWRW